MNMMSMTLRRISLSVLTNVVSNKALLKMALLEQLTVMIKIISPISRLAIRPNNKEK